MVVGTRVVQSMFVKVVTGQEFRTQLYCEDRGEVTGYVHV